MKASSIPGFFGYFELYEKFVSECPENQTIIEIGSFKGRSFGHLIELCSKSNKKINIVAIDHFNGSSEHNESSLFIEFNKNMESLDSKYPFIVIKANSLDIAKIIKDKSIFAILIDASHDYDNVKSDILAWKDKIISNGYLAGDDYDWPGVSKAVDELIPEAIKVGRKGDCCTDIKAGNFWIKKYEG